MDLWPDKSGMTWRGKLRLRALVFVLGVPLAVIGMISISPAWLTLPLVGVAVAAVTVTVNAAGQKLAQRTCWTCGSDLRNEPPSEHGIACPKCGSLNQFRVSLFAKVDDATRGDATKRS